MYYMHIVHVHVACIIHVHVQYHPTVLLSLRPTKWAVLQVNVVSYWPFEQQIGSTVMVQDNLHKSLPNLASPDAPTCNRYHPHDFDMFVKFSPPLL